MNLKTYQADTMAKALKLVKNELGNQAVILHTRSFKRGGILGLGAKAVVEITASNDVSIVPPKMRRQVLNPNSSQTATPLTSNTQPAELTTIPASNHLLRDTYQQSPPTPTSHTSTPNTPTPTPAPSPTVTIPAIQQPVLRHANPPRLAQGAPVTPVNPTTITPPSTPIPTPSTQVTDNLSEEIQHIRQMVTRMMNQQASETKKDLPDQLFNQYLSLLEQEVTEELADEVIQNVRQNLSAKQLDDKQTVQAAVGQEIADLIDFDAEAIDKDSPTDGRPRTIALIGPTGVGKTTTTAKLAATFKLHKNKKVALITLDTYRIAAVDQLQTYADIIDVPLFVAQTIDEMADALEKCSHCDVILIDTAGRSQRDDEKLQDLSTFIEAASPHEVHLVLSSTSNQAVLMEAVDRFKQVRIDRVIFTKLDEAVSFGVLLNVARKVNKQLSYITTGQDVPHQIEQGCPDRLASLILGEGL